MARKKVIDAEMGVFRGIDKDGKEVVIPLTKVPPGTPLPKHRHGPSQPAKRLFGVPHLRRIMARSDAVSVDQLCDEAARQIEELRSIAPRPAWSSRLRYRSV